MDPLQDDWGCTHTPTPAAILDGLWCISLKLVSTSSGALYANMSSTVCRMQWNLVVFKPIPSSLELIFFNQLHDALVFLGQHWTSFKGIVVLLSQSTHYRRVSSNMIQPETVL
jgi:hypothetical protein